MIDHMLPFLNLWQSPKYDEMMIIKAQSLLDNEVVNISLSDTGVEQGSWRLAELGSARQAALDCAAVTRLAHPAHTGHWSRWWPGLLRVCWSVQDTRTTAWSLQPTASDLAPTTPTVYDQCC